MDYKEFYTSNADFKKYVDKYAKAYNLTVDQALSHLIPQYVARHYKEGTNK